jgi:hypothetical protein
MDIVPLRRHWLLAAWAQPGAYPPSNLIGIFACSLQKERSDYVKVVTIGQDPDPTLCDFTQSAIAFKAEYAGAQAIRR